MGINFYKDGDKLVLIIEGMSELDEQSLVSCLAARAIKECSDAYAEPEQEDIKANPENLQPIGPTATATKATETTDTPETAETAEPEKSLFEKYNEITDIKAYVEGLQEDDVKTIVKDISPCMTDTQKASFIEKYHVVSWEDVEKLDAVKSVAMNLIYWVQKRKIVKNP